jgi:hypothetical protein
MKLSTFSVLLLTARSSGCRCVEFGKVPTQDNCKICFAQTTFLREKRMPLLGARLAVILLDLSKCFILKSNTVFTALL